MRAFEFLVESAPVPKTIGREFNHLEDLAFTEPSGGRRAIEILKRLSRDAKDIAIKWDGNPTVYWGRDADGTFHLVGKNNWGREDGKSSSPEELQKFILGRGKGEDWRGKFASDMAAMWPIFESATPKNFRGYIYGDILFHPGKPYQGADGHITFTPNQTTYSVKGTSDIGRRIAKATVAVAAHKLYEYFGDKTGVDIDDVSDFNSTPVLVVFGQTYVSHQPAIDAKNLHEIEKIVNQRGAGIDSFLAPVAGMGYLQASIYSFVNAQSKAKQLANINSNAFFDFLSATPAKLKKIQEHSAKHKGILDVLFQLVTALMLAKNEVIAELDQAESDITAHTAGEPGGEGYMSGKDQVKLVPRHRWTPFRSD